MMPGRGRGPALRRDRREAVTPVCWTSLGTAQLTARARDQGRGLLPEPFGSPGATALKGSDDCLKQLGVPGAGLGGCFLDKPGKLAAIRQQRRSAVSTSAPG